MPAEVAVFLQERGVHQKRRHPVERDPNPVGAIRGQGHPQQATVPIVDGGGRRKARPQRLMWDDSRDEPERKPGGSCDRRGTPHAAHRHLGRPTTMWPGADQARTDRSYMPSPYAGGTANEPTAVAFTV